MIVTIISVILFLVFSILGGFHFYWLFGGEWWLKKVIPTKGNEPNSLSIPEIATLTVALVLVAFGLIYLLKTGIITIVTPKIITNYAYWLIPAVFTMRALGDFKYVGFFKKIKHTEFAKADTKLFSPLCLGIGILGFIAVSYTHLTLPTIYSV